MKFKYTMSLLILIIFSIAGCGNQDNTISDISTTHSASSTESHASIAGLAEDENVLMPVSDANREIVFSSEHYTILGNDAIQANKIISVTFLDSLTNTPEDAWDVSEAGDSSVMAWVIEDEEIRLNDEPACHLYIAGEGGVNANQDSSYLFSNYASLASIEFNNCFFTSAVTDMSHMFSSTAVTTLDLSSFDTSKVTDMSDMFNCYFLTELDVSGFDTSQVTNMQNMFCFCMYLICLDLSSFDTSNVTDMSSMFAYCSSLNSLNLTGFDTSHVTTMSNMFYQCTSLASVNLSSFDTSSVIDMCSMFSGCSSLEDITVSSGFVTEQADTTDMFMDAGSEIIMQMNSPSCLLAGCSSKSDNKSDAITCSPVPAFLAIRTFSVRSSYLFVPGNSC